MKYTENIGKRDFSMICLALVSLKQCETMRTVATNQNPRTVRSLIHIVL